MSDYVIERRWAMPSGATFTIKPIKSIVSNEVFEAYIRANGNAVIIDPFARKSQFGTLTNDINPEYSTDYHMDALDFMREQPDEIADLVLYDPPYSITQAAQLYKSYGKEKLEVNVSNMAYWARLKDEIARVLKRGGLPFVADGTATDLEKSGGSSWSAFCSFRMVAARTTQSLPSRERRTNETMRQGQDTVPSRAVSGVSGHQVLQGLRVRRNVR